MKVGLISDTHIPHAIRALPRALLKGLEGVDRILHAGDLVTTEVVRELETIAPVTAVSGNMDPPEVAGQLRSEENLLLGGRRIGLKHGHQRSGLQSRYIGLGYDAPEFDLFYQAMATQLPGSEVIVFGHFHAAVIKEWNGTLFINPGAVAPTHGPSTYAILELGETIHARILQLPAPGA